MVEMIIFEKYRLMEKLIGLDPLGGRRNTVIRIVYSVAFTSFILMEIFAINLNIHDGLDRVALVVTSLFGAIPMMISYGHLLISRDHYHSISSEMQDIVNGSGYHIIFNICSGDVR